VTVMRGMASNLDGSSDEQLLEAVAKGSKDALGLLFRLHGRAVFNVAWRILRDNSEADDLRQDVFLYVFERAKLFDAGKGSASSWIMQVAYHRAIDRRRYLVSRKHYDAHQFDEQQTQLSTAPSLSDAIDGTAILNRLRGELSAEQRETLELHLFEGYSLREIAEKNGQSVGNVRHHYYRAIERLRSHVFPRKRP
jgi:RNA polymerase sigma-70 factor (ECF subfamily)